MENKLDLNHQIKVSMTPHYQKNQKVPISNIYPDYYEKIENLSQY